ncbi:phospholipase A [Ottowia sp.]|uniref:phospholipase A n=1 Tax=Ottowia sp. TaxID=1898956 RepID=UPI003A878F9C
MFSLRLSHRLTVTSGPLALFTAALVPGLAAAQAAAPIAADITPRIEQSIAWQACVDQPDSERLACFDRWAQNQQALMSAIEEKAHSVGTSPTRLSDPYADPTDTASQQSAALATTQPDVGNSHTPSGSTGIVGVGLEQGCRDRQFSDLSRFWELESGSSCPTFGLRAFHPGTIAAAASDRVNQQPTSANPVNTASTATAYDKQEMRLQLSVRTKLAAGIFTPAGGTRRDSLWAAYTAQSSWQLFNGALSRPFRNTDHMPELIYIYPTTLDLPGGWTWRYSGAGLVHQSNGQSDPLSRSWNRAYLMAGFEKDNRLNLQLRWWKRLSESSAKDNNPDISRYIGRGDISLGWNINTKNTLRLTYTGSFNKYGSGKLEWTRSLGDGLGNSFSGLRLYTSLFYGYGDSLIDYNFRRTVFSIGLSLSDF